MRGNVTFARPNLSDRNRRTDSLPACELPNESSDLARVTHDRIDAAQILPRMDGARVVGRKFV
jgi:hypothetical protein